MLPFSGTVSSQIRYLLESLNETNAESIYQELCKYIGYGTEGSILVLQTCFDQLNINGNDLKNMQVDPIFASIFRYILDKPNFSTVLCESLRSKEVSEDLLENICNAFQVVAHEKIVVGIALSDSEDLNIRTCGKTFCLAQIAQICASHVSVDSAERIQNILMFLNRSEGLRKHVDSFMQMLSLVHLKEDSQSTLAPLLSDELRETNFFRSLDMLYERPENDFDTIVAEMEKEMSMGDVMKELGYGCTENVSQCKELLSLFFPLTEITVARVLGTVVRTNGGLEDNHSTYLTTFSSTFGTSSLSELPLLDSWNIDVLIDSIKQLAPGINWINVFEKLDHEGFYIPNEAAFSLLMSIYRHVCQDPFPLRVICGSVWKNAEGQLSFLKCAVSVPPEVFSFSHSERQLACSDAVNGNKFQPGHANHAWLCLDLLEVLCQLAERGHANSVRLILKYPLKHCPEVLLLGMANINTAYCLLQYEVSSVVFPLVLKNVTGSSVVHRLWHVNPSILVRGFIDELNMDPDSMSRVLDLCNELKILPPVLDMIPLYFGIRLAALASRKELLDLEGWLSTNLSTFKDTLSEECLKFVKEVQFSTQDMLVTHFRQSDLLSNIYAETIPTFLKVLQSHTGLLSSGKLFEEIEKLNAAPIHANVRVTDASTSDGHADGIEREMNSYFHQMLSDKLTVESMVQILARYKESSDKREQSIFECMIANLFEEYKFFSKYPEAQLKIVAVLFGSLIKHQLVTHLTLGFALRAVLDALRKPTDSKMFVFGTKAVEQFVDRLVEWPQYCNHILQISHLCVTHPELITFIERALARISSGHPKIDAVAAADQQNAFIPAASVEMTSSSFLLIGSSSTQAGSHQVSSPVRLHQTQESSNKVSAPVSNNMKPVLPSAGHPSGVPSSDISSTQKLQSTANASAASSSSPGFVRPSRAATSARFGSALNIETLVAAAERRETQTPIVAPASEIQDKVSFIINNLSLANVEAKAKEFSEILKEQYYPWFAQYMVMKRASIEGNFHDLYLKFLDKVNSKPLNKEIVQATYENCKVLVRSELIKSSSEERSLLKSLGSWLGKLTVGKNQVLRAKEIDPKSLLIEAYEKGLLIAVVPFTSKILELCPNSIAYRPPNPWTMGILGLLTEIYAMPNLKMNIKFEIEMLFKHFVDFKDVKPTSLLKDRVREVEGNPDFSNKDVASSQASSQLQIVAEIKSGTAVSALNQVEPPLDAAAPSLPTHSRIMSQYTTPLHLPSATLIEDEKLTSLSISDQLPSVRGLQQGQSPFPVGQLHAPASSNIEQQVVVNTKLQGPGLDMHFQSVLPVAIDRAIKEIVSSIVQRSVSIAIQTTKELVLKDYAMESDDTRIRSAAHLMVASLAGSLAHVTCKEPLRGSITSHLRNLLQGLNIASEILEQAVQLVTNDNLDLGCALIEQAATEKAVQTVDGELAQQLSIRRKQREGAGPTFFDANLYTQDHMGVLPEALRPKPGRLSHSQQRVYEDFVRLPWQNQSTQNSNALPVGMSTSVNGGSASGQLNPGIYSSGPEELDSELQFAEPSNALKESGVTSQSLPSTSAAERLGSNISEPLLTTGDALDKYQLVSQKLETLVINDTMQAEIPAIIAEVPGIILRCISRDEAALAVAQKVFKGLYENAPNSAHVHAHLSILAAIRDVSKLVVKELTSWVIYSDEGRKFNTDITVGLIHSELLNLAEYNVHMGKLLDAGRNKAATDFAISLIQTLVTSDSKVISELHHLVDALAKLAARPGSPESLQQLVEVARNPAAKEDTTTQSKAKKATGHSAASWEEHNVSDSVEPDPSGFRDQVSMLFEEWYRICELTGENDTARARFVLQLLQNGLLEGNDMSDRFFRLLTELSLSHFFSSEVQSTGPRQSQSLSFLAIDTYAELIFSILKFYSVDQGSSKISLLSKVLAVTVRCIHKDAEKRTSFNPRPYFRLFINFLADLPTLEPVSDGANLQVLTALANAFHALQPVRVPAFSFAWLELVSHRSYMPKLLTGNSQKCWPLFQRLLVDLFQFLDPFLRNVELTEPVQFLYKGTLRVLLVLLHDFPEFLCEYHFSFCDVLPPGCIQMRNVILSAFPRNMKLPDPSTPNLKIDLLAEISQPPRILSEVDAILKAKQIKGDVDEYLKMRQKGSPFLSELKQKLLLPSSDVARAGTHYNVPVINSLVLYTGMQAIQQLQARSPGSQMGVHLVSAALDIFQMLVLELDEEGHYHFFNAIANQLRYPNNHTHYFSFMLLYLFAEANREVIQEQITRVLVERLIVNRPHPWGLLITFIELIKNPRYNFWSMSFTRCAPEIERLFDSVARSCGSPGVPKPIDGPVSSGLSDMH